MARLGSMAWGEKSDGILSATDRMKTLGGLVQAQVMNALSRTARRLGAYDRHRRRIDVDRLTSPDSTATRRAEALADQHYSRPLRLHCLRTYIFGMLWAQFHDLEVDTETLYVASLLHDLGLTPAYQAATRCCGFGIVSARTARDLAGEHDWSADRQRQVYEAVSYHLNPYLSLARHEPEAVCLQRAAHLDVVGARRHLLPNHAISSVHRKYPRDGFRSEIMASISELEHAPNSHAPVLMSFGFARLAGRNPLDRQFGTE